MTSDKTRERTEYKEGTKMEQNAMIVDYLKTALTQKGDENFHVEAFMNT